MTIEYTELDKVEMLGKVRARISEVERQHFDLSLRTQTPDLNVPPSEMDTRNLAKLEESLTKLRAMEKELNPQTSE